MLRDTQTTLLLVGGKHMNLWPGTLAEAHMMSDGIQKIEDLEKPYQVNWD